MIDFKVPRLKDCILIDTKEWVQNANSIIESRKMSGRTIPTYISKVQELDAERGVFKNVLNKGDTVLLTRVASEIAQYRTFAIEGNDKRYFSVPITQAIGVFKDKEMSLQSFQMLFDKILIKRIKEEELDGIAISESNTMVGEVVKTGWCRFDKNWNTLPMKTKVGDKVLIRDNVTTEVVLSGETYYATEEAMVVGIFKGGDLNLNSLWVINDNVIFLPYIMEHLYGSVLITPLLNYEDEDTTDIYNRNLFKVVASDSALTKVKKDDIILVDRNVTNYVYLNSKKYFILSGIDCIEAKIEERNQ